MDQTTRNQEVYDFRQYDRIWQRVAPNLEPYPGMNVQQPASGGQMASGQQMTSGQQTASAWQTTSVRSEAGAVPTTPAPTAPVVSAPVQAGYPQTPAAPVPVGPGMVQGQESQLPGAVQNPCCMGTAAMDMLDVITGYIEASLSDRRYLLALARQAPSWARQTLREQAADLQSHARQLMAAHYLITGRTYQPSVSGARVYVGRWCPALRERYHAAACSGFNYARSSEDTMDPCLAKLFESLSEDAYRHAEELMRMVQRQLGMRN